MKHVHWKRLAAQGLELWKVGNTAGGFPGLPVPVPTETPTCTTSTVFGAVIIILLNGKVTVLVLELTSATFYRLHFAGGNKIESGRMH